MNPTYPGKILLIDDDQDTRDIYSEFLTNGGFSVDLAADGEEGLAKILQGGYDLILLDIMMPKIDGITILKKLKENPPDVYNGPIVILSALDQEYVVKSAMELGAKGFLAKSSMNPDEALKKISEFMQTPKTPA
ncbi:response regulator [Candidatus Daviesbacteria bacterium]|nr:response regulator [Candidatus Daviesbacteria bacterium]